MQSITLAKGSTMEEPGSCFFLQMKSVHYLDLGGHFCLHGGHGGPGGHFFWPSGGGHG